MIVEEDHNHEFDLVMHPDLEEEQLKLLQPFNNIEIQPFKNEFTWTRATSSGLDQETTPYDDTCAPQKFLGFSNDEDDLLYPQQSKPIQKMSTNFDFEISEDEKISKFIATLDTIEQRLKKNTKSPLRSP